MKECWINVYPNHLFGIYWDSREKAEFIRRTKTVAYRLHVKLKDEPCSDHTKLSNQTKNI